MSGDEHDRRPSTGGSVRPVWLQLVIGLVMAVVVLAGLYLLFSRLL